MLYARLPLLALLCLFFANVQADTPLFSADGYRISLYRSPTPDHLPGATIVDTAALQTLLSQTPAPVLIDVYRRQWLQASALGLLATTPYAQGFTMGFNSNRIETDIFKLSTTIDTMQIVPTSKLVSSIFCFALAY